MSVMVALVAVGCGGSDSSTSTSGSGKSGGSADQPKQARIAVFGPAGNNFVSSFMQEAKATAAGLNAKVDLIDTKFAPNDELAAMQDAMASKRYEAFIVFPLDSRSIVPSVKSAIAQDIKVVSVDLPLTEKQLRDADPGVPGLSGSILDPFGDQGDAIANMIVSACADKKPCTVGYIPGIMTLPNDKVQLDQVKAGVKAHPDIKLVVGSEGKYLSAPAITAVQDLLQANPDMSVVATSGDQMTIGAERAVKDAGREGKIALIGNGVTEQAYAAIKAGRWFGSVPSLPKTQGRTSVEIAVKAVRGQTIDKPFLVSADEEGVPLEVTTQNKPKWEQFQPQWKG